MLTLRTLFDSKFYLENNPDVAVAVARGTVSSAFDHYRKIGKFENRDPNALFDASYYLETNTDVAESAKNNGFSGADHFIRFGQFEVRNPNPLFDVGFYLASNPDVQTAVQANQFTVFEHYLKVGQFENRKPSAFFDPSFYLEKYPLIQAAVTSGAVQSAIDHYIQFGQQEGLLSTLPEPADNLNAAQNLGILTEIQTASDFVGAAQPTDIYSFILNSPSLFSATVDGLSADVDVELIQDLNGNGAVGLEDLIASSNNLGTASETIVSNGALPAGTYFVRVSQFQGDTNYNLRLLSAPSEIPPQI
ncbi:PPC domain-containing protein [Tychonema sp. LEGE 07203]|uniref:PPC domain-containing protein n=1 Tax=Tychonema sp. LEGE 07203 TaxID=1828671 RepID=UPI00188038A4|nr:PPC domain-containing protein [Tychonema sp. LEGE 07203]MBE9095466.1 PPC domain-containing protein [Tychonema sp. LEGE 07203]